MADKTSEIKDIPCETFPLFLRNNYFYGKLLTVSSFQMEQQYFINKHRLGNLLIHGSGVVCGLQVSKSGNHEITISSGVALDQCGREIILSDTHILDLNKELSSPISPAKIYLKSAVEGRDLTTKILKSATYSDESCYSTIEEKYQIEIESSTKQSTQFAETLQSKGIALSTPKEEKTTASPIDNVALLLTQPTITSKDSLSFAIEKKKEGFYVRSCPVSSEERVLLAQVFFNVDEKGSIAIEHIATNRPVVYTNETL